MDNEQTPVSQVEFLALRLEDTSPHPAWYKSAATELRRQHAEIEMLTAALAAVRDERGEWQALAADECAKASAATKARQAAQSEAEVLKERIARSGVELQRAVWKERERCISEAKRAIMEAPTAHLISRTS